MKKILNILKNVRYCELDLLVKLKLPKSGKKIGIWQFNRNFTNFQHFTTFTVRNVVAAK